MSEGLPSGILRRAETKVEFVDQYGDKRVIHRLKGRKLAVKRSGNTVCHAMNRIIAGYIATRIREERIKAKMSLAGLCLRAGLSTSFPKNRMYEIEMGLRQDGLMMGTLYAIAIALGVPVASLLPDQNAIMDAAMVNFVDNPPGRRIAGAAEVLMIEENQ